MESVRNGKLNAYEPERILVTGGAGFIGSHVVKKLLAKYPDKRVVVLDSLTYAASMKNLEGLEEEYKGFKMVHGDITSSDLVAYLMECEQFDTILHFAAETHVDHSFGNSFKFTQTNVMGTHVLLEAAKRMGPTVKRFIHCSTDEVYGESKQQGDVFQEESVLEPTNPYAATKAAAEFLCKAYHRSFNVPVVITRGNNVYGPAQYPEKMIPKFINQMVRGKPMTIHGDGSTCRNLLYVTDVAEAFLTVMEFAQPGQTLNVGGKYEYTVLQVAEKILDLFGKRHEKEKLLQFCENRAFNDTRYSIDSSKLQELGWEQKVEFDEGLRATFKWYLDNENHWGSIEHALAAHPRFFGDYNAHEPPAIHTDRQQTL